MASTTGSNDLWRFQRLMEQFSMWPELPPDTKGPRLRFLRWRLGQDQVQLQLKLRHDKATCWLELAVVDIRDDEVFRVIRATRYYCRVALPRTYSRPKDVESQVLETYPNLAEAIKDDIETQVRVFGRPRRPRA